MGRCIIPRELQLSNCCIFNVALQPWPRSQLAHIDSANNCFHIWGIFLILSITWPCSMFLSPPTSPAASQNFTCCTLQTTATTKQSAFTTPWSLSYQAIIRLLLPFWQYPHPDQPPKWNWCSICGYQHKGIWKCVWVFARAQDSCRMQPEPSWRAWSQSSHRPICGHSNGTWHKQGWKELPWDNDSPGHCPKFRARSRWSAKLLCLATFNKTHRLIYQPE